MPVKKYPGAKVSQKGDIPDHLSWLQFKTGSTSLQNRMILICPYYNSLDTNSFTKVGNALRMGDWWHSLQIAPECSLIIGTDCRVQVFSLILDSSVGLSAGIQSAGDSVPKTESRIQQRKTTCLLPIRILLACATALKLQQCTCMHLCICMHACICVYACIYLYACMYVYTNACMHACVNLCIHNFVEISLYIFK